MGKSNAEPPGEAAESTVGTAASDVHAEHAAKVAEMQQAVDAIESPDERRARQEWLNAHVGHPAGTGAVNEPKPEKKPEKEGEQA